MISATSKQYRLKEKAKEVFLQFVEDKDKYLERMYKRIEEVKEELGLDDDVQPMFSRGTNWCAFTPNAYEQAPKALCKPKDGYCTPRRSTKVGKQLLEEMQDFGSPPTVWDKEYLGQFGFTGMYISKGFRVHWAGHTMLEDEVYIFGIPEEAINMADGSFKGPDPEFTEEVGLAEWAKIVEEIENE